MTEKGDVDPLACNRLVGEAIVDYNGNAIRIGDSFALTLSAVSAKPEKFAPRKIYGPITSLGANPPGNVFVGHRGFRGSTIEVCADD